MGLGDEVEITAEESFLSFFLSFFRLHSILSSSFFPSFPFLFHSSFFFLLSSSFSLFGFCFSIAGRDEAEGEGGRGPCWTLLTNCFLVFSFIMILFAFR